MSNNARPSSDQTPLIADPTPPPLLEAVDLTRSYRMGTQDIHVIRGLNLCIERGSFTIIVGHSGCGKSTLLHMFGLLERPSSGKLLLDGVNAQAQSGRWREQVRNRRMGFVFQFFHLLPELTVLGNVMLPEMIRYGPLRWWSVRGDVRRRAMETLERVGLGDRMKFPPNRLSGGERQRVAIARSLVYDPEIIFADEPTGNLDTDSGWQVFEMLRGFAAEDRKTVVMVTHDNRFLPEAEVILHLAGGRIVDAETAREIEQTHEKKGP